MKKSIYPCLWFDGNAKEAMSFYVEVFGNSKITDENPTVVISQLWGQKFMGLNGGPKFKINPSISFTVSCNSLEETNRIWGLLVADGNPLMPIDKYPWSERYGWLADKFGVNWQISIGENSQITPSMLFTNAQLGNAESAIDTYLKIFPNSGKDLVVHYPSDSEYAGKIMYSEFKLNNFPFIAMDGPGEHDYIFNEAVSIVVECETQDEIDHYWENLSAGGREDMCGWLKDKFGVSWQIVPSILGELMRDPERGQRVMNAFLKMRKFEIEKLLNA